MPKEKLIYTITKTAYEGGDITHRYERAFESLHDALQHIAIWSNMKIMNGYTISISNGKIECLTEEHRYIAEKVDNEYKWVTDLEELVLRKVTLVLEKEP